MKKLMLGLFVCLAFGLSTQAEVSTVKVKSTTSITHSPPQGFYRIGTHHRRLPRQARRTIINGDVFFVHRGSYFQPVRRGFIVVERPRVYRPRPNYNYNRGYQRGYDRGYYQGRGSSRYATPYRRGCRR